MLDIFSFKCVESLSFFFSAAYYSIVWPYLDLLTSPLLTGCFHLAKTDKAAVSKLVCTLFGMSAGVSVAEGPCFTTTLCCGTLASGSLFMCT